MGHSWECPVNLIGSTAKLLVVTPSGEAVAKPEAKSAYGYCGQFYDFQDQCVLLQICEIPKQSGYRYNQQSHDNRLPFPRMLAVLQISISILIGRCNQGCYMLWSQFFYNRVRKTAHETG